MNRLKVIICGMFLLSCLTSCSIPTDDIYRTETYEFCCCETCCEGFETWDETWERDDDEISKTETQTGYHVTLTRSYHN